MPETILQSEFDCLSYFTLWTFPRPVKMHQLITKLHNSDDSKLQKAISPMGMLPHSVWEFGWYQSERFLRWICFCLVQHTAVTCNRFDVNRKKAFHSTLLETYGSHTYKTLIIFKVFFWFSDGNDWNISFLKHSRNSSVCALAQYTDFAAESSFVSVQGVPPSLRAQEAIWETCW